SSRDLDGSIVSYLWEQVGGSPSVTITNPNSVVTSFIAPSISTDSELAFKLSVTDNLGASSSDEVKITLKNINSGPVSNAGVDQIAVEGSVVTLNGTATDNDPSSLTVIWNQTAGPSVKLS